MAIAAIVYFCDRFVSAQSGTLLVASMGASAVLLNALVIVSVAVAFNALLGSRRYPAYLAARQP